MSDQSLRIPALRILPRLTWLTRTGRHSIGLTLGIILLVSFALLGLLPALLDLPSPEHMDLLARLSGPSAAHPLGTDHLG
ncbi:MAG: hypothetical protein MJH10_17855, partial [Epibacterium sp.]|nr:hypothetical protein [Epibacterium sp.]NQX75362.1 hypothetical protein [Epibacterium sp.]